MDPGDRSSSTGARLATNLSPELRDLIKRYGLALALASVALVLRSQLALPEATAIYPLPLAAVVLSAWYGGRGPGLVAAVIGAAGTLYLFIPPVSSFEVAPDHAPGFAIFVAVSLLLSEFSSVRRRATQALRASEERFQALVQFSFDVYWESDAWHRFTRQEFSERLTDAPPRGAEIGKTRWEIPYVEPDEEAWREHRATMDAHLPFRDFELARPTADGGKRYVSVSGMPVFDSAGRFVGYRGVGRHITERKRVEAELRARQDMLDLAQKAARAVAFDWYIGARESENRWSPELEAMYGLEPGTFDRTFEGWKKLVHPDDWPAAKLALKRAQESGDIAAEYRVTHNDGAVHWLRAKGRMFFDAEGQPERMVGFMIDITDLRHAEEEHRAHLWFLESMDRINRAMQGTQDLQQMLSDVLLATLEIFASDRAWLIYPCDPDAPSWHAVMEHTRPQFPGAFALQAELPVDLEVAAVFAATRAAPGAVLFGADGELKIPASAADRFSIRSQIAMAIDSKADKPYLFGLHQCSHVRVWTGEEQRLFQEIGRRLGDAIAALSMLRGVRDSERKLDAAQRIAHVGWWERDFVRKRVSLSDEAQRIFGVAPVALPQWQDRWVNLIHPEDRARAAEAAAAAMRGGPRYDVEYRIIRPDGKVRVVHSHGDVAWDEAGQPVRQFGVMQDITELRRAEDELSEIRERFRVLAESSLTGIYLTENDRFSYVNPALAKMFGYAVEEIVGRLGSMDLTYPDDRPLVAENLRRRLSGSAEELRYEFRGLRKDGSMFPVEVHDRRVEHGGKIGVLGTLVDNTERKRADESLRESEAYLTEAQRLSHTGSWALDVASNRYLYTSEEFDRMFGFDPDGEILTTEAVLARMHPEDRISWKRILEKSVREKLDTTSQYRIVLPDGSIRHIHTIRHPVVNSAGEVVKLVGTSIDITERIGAEEELRASEARFRTFVDHATDAFFLHGDDLLIVDVNRQACDSLGYNREELIGMHPRDFDLGLDEPSLMRLAQRVGAGEAVTFETLHRRKDGTVFPVEIRARMFQQTDKRFRLSLVRDISDRKLTEETLRAKEDALQVARTELARVSRVMTMGELTASIAHEVNQPLGAMVANAAACARWLAAEPAEIAKTRKALDSIAADGRRASEVIGHIRALVKREAPRKLLLDINQKVRDMVALSEQELRRQDIALELHPADRLPAVAGDRVQLQQVLLNLIVNAIEAMGAVHDRPRAMTIASRQDGADGVVVEVRDSGTGLDAEHAERLFEAFYTTKSEGIGIGLSISRSIAEAHGGRLSAARNLPHGAVFKLWLPAAASG
jgi:PAS domain S-box-containing protein